MEKEMGGSFGMMMGQNNNDNGRVAAPQIYVTEKAFDLSRLKIRFKAETEVKTAYAALPTQSSPLKGVKKPRTVLAEWVISSSNPYTAKAVANWVTHWLLGRAWVMPVSDIYGGTSFRKNLLNKCAAILQKNNWDLNDLVKTIVTSEFYRMKSARENNEELFLQFKARRYRHLSGEQLINSMSQYMVKKSSNSRYAKLQEFRRQRQINQVTNKFFPSSLEDTDSGFTGTLGQTLFMANNDQTLKFVETMALRGFRSKSDEKIWVTSAIRALFTREPTLKEINFFLKYLDKKADYQSSGYFDVAWALLNSPEMRLY